jgi:hypothetical protein
MRRVGDWFGCLYFILAIANSLATAAADDTILTSRLKVEQETFSPPFLTQISSKVSFLRKKVIF